ncbi:MAG: SDR family NAD(P)-dependent oxidoreductase [Bacteroidetes bacterium]|nr:SDR family NAD(P)-dependent oxidoreductase [Bacteroidota bacterium]
MRVNLIQKYGQLALVAGASEGIGAAFATYLAAEGLNLVLVARRKEPLDKLAELLRLKYKVDVECITCDLAENIAAEQLQTALLGKEFNLFVYNAALSYIGAFEKNTIVNHNQIAQANMITPMNMMQFFAEPMLKKKKGAMILMASLAGFQGSGFLAAYAATKAFNRVLAESLWYEWKDRGVDVIACCAGATSTPNFINTKPEKADFFAPRVQSPEEVVAECFKKLGKQPSFVTGTGNKMASFIMQKLLPRKMAINIMGDTTRKMYRL